MGIQQRVFELVTKILECWGRVGRGVTIFWAQDISPEDKGQTWREAGTDLGRTYPYSA